MSWHELGLVVSSIPPPPSGVDRLYFVLALVQSIRDECTFFGLFHVTYVA